MSYIGSTPTTQGFIPAIDFFSGNGATVAFTLSRPVASVAQVQATIENVPQNPGTAFTVSGNTITFDGAPASGTNNIYVYYTSPITQVIAPSQGTVFPSTLSTGGPSWDTSGNLGVGGTSTIVHPALNRYVSVQSSTNNDVVGYNLFVNDGSNNRRGSFFLDDNAGVFGLDVTAGTGVPNIVFRTAGTTRLQISDGGLVTTPFQPAFVARAQNAQTAGNGWAQVNYDNNITQRGSSYNSSNSRFTAPVSGWYQFNASWTATSNSDGDGTLSLSINGSTAVLISSASFPTTGPNFEGHVVSGCGFLNAGDYVVVLRYSDVSTTTRSSIEYGGYFSGYLIG
jgi:hypothetical protein